MYLPGVSLSTFSDDLCTPSGWWAKNLASKGIVNADNTIVNTENGYTFLATTRRQIDIDTDGELATVSVASIVTCVATGDCADTAPTVSGFVGDLSGDLQGNPLGASGLNYRQCRAVTRSQRRHSSPVTKSLRYHRRGRNCKYLACKYCCNGVSFVVCLKQR